jgi:hypothetical protein
LKEWIIQYHRHGKPIPEGFERHDGLDDTHHGHHASFIVQEVSVTDDTPPTLPNLSSDPHQTE